MRPPELWIGQELQLPPTPTGFAQTKKPDRPGPVASPNTKQLFGGAGAAHREAPRSG